MAGILTLPDFMEKYAYCYGLGSFKANTEWEALADTYLSAEDAETFKGYLNRQTRVTGWERDWSREPMWYFWD